MLNTVLHPFSNHRILFKYGIIIVILLSGCSDNPMEAEGGEENGILIDGFRVKSLVTGLDTPWDMIWGPEGDIWVSERNGNISSVDTSTGEIRHIGQIDVVENGESGLMGIALHPDFDNEPYLYAVHSYQTGNSIKNRLIRMRFSGTVLGIPEILLDNIPGATIHNGARLAIGPDNLLYLSMGDAAAQKQAQNLASLSGKILRLTLQGEPATGNPFGSAVYSYGHRNPQGLVFHPVSGILYSTEHGPSDNDEVNIIEDGRNYGWPNVRGFCDGDVADEQQFCTANNVKEPLAVWTPTTAVSGADIYNAHLMPGWNGSLLFTTLKGSALYRLSLSADGERITGQEVLFRGTFGRLRDVLVGPRGEVYIATSNRDGRGSPAAEDDRIIKIIPADNKKA